LAHAHAQEEVLHVFYWSVVRYEF